MYWYGMQDPVSVLLDGRVLGEVSARELANLALKLRTMKALGKEKVRICW